MVKFSGETKAVVRTCTINIASLGRSLFFPESSKTRAVIVCLQTVKLIEGQSFETKPYSIVEYDVYYNKASLFLSNKLVVNSILFKNSSHMKDMIIRKCVATNSEVWTTYYLWISTEHIIFILTEQQLNYLISSIHQFEPWVECKIYLRITNMLIKQIDHQHIKNAT